MEEPSSPAARTRMKGMVRWVNRRIGQEKEKENGA